MNALLFDSCVITAKLAFKMSTEFFKANSIFFTASFETLWFTKFSNIKQLIPFLLSM